MAQEGTETDDVTGQQTESQHNEGDAHDDQELHQMTVAGTQLISIGHQETGQEEIVQQINIQGSSTYILQGFGKTNLLKPRT